jgi:hypothetical protein
MSTANPKDLLGVLKPSLHLVPPALKIWVARAMENGAKKYGPYNWRDKKVKMTVYIASAMRHLEQLLDGEDLAEDSEVHHAAHTAACCGIILDALECKCLIDDRPLKGCASELITRFTRSSAPALSVPPVPLKDPKKKYIYVAGPMRGIKDFNFPAFYRAESTLVSLGYEVFNPARRDESKYGQGKLKSETGDENEIAATAGFNLREALGADCQWITEFADAICLLPGWEASKGANAEVALARALNLEVILWDTLCSIHDVNCKLDCGEQNPV